MKIWKTLAVSAALALPAFAQSAAPFAGRWDITITTPTATYPDWMELVDQPGGPQVRIQPRGGAQHPAAAVKVQGSHLLVTVDPARGNRPEMTWDLTVSGDKLLGTQTRGSDTAQVSGVRAPKLDRPMPKAWNAPQPLFNGKDLTGWEALGNPTNSHWVVKNGELVNETRGSNLRTVPTFQDFKLHIEVSCPPEHCNSGIYLRGRYEVQVGTEGGTQPSHEMGAIYGYIAPSQPVPIKANQWQTFDITFVGRRVTVVADGVKVHDNVEIPGITGGALDANEAEPGPIFLQGDHTGGLRYRNITISTAKQ